jgi:hypothetical protein
MVTSYSIEVGYNSGKQPDEVWEALKNAVAKIQANPQQLFVEILQFEPDANLQMIEEIVGNYKAPVNDLTLKVVEKEGFQAVWQWASGGEPYRGAKESCRRAFCRLILYEMHQQKMEVNIVVS